MIALLKNIPKLWNEFWFESNLAFNMDVFRRLVGFILFSCYLVRTADINLFYTEGGMLPISRVNDTMFMQGRYSLLLWFPSDAMVWACHILFLLALLGMSFGSVRKKLAGVSIAKISTVIAFILHISFMHRMLIIAYGVDLISVFFLFFLCFSDLRTSSLAGENQVGSDVRSLMGSVAYRLAQLQLCLIYAFGGCEKLRGSHWWQGEAVWDMMANIQIARFDATWLAHFPSLIVIMTFAALIWEIYFPVLVWVKVLRPYVLLMGVIMHLTIMIAVDLPYFSLLMISTYVLFLEPAQVTRLFKIRHFA